MESNASGDVLELLALTQGLLPVRLMFRGQALRLYSHFQGIKTLLFEFIGIDILFDRSRVLFGKTLRMFTFKNLFKHVHMRFSQLFSEFHAQGLE